MAKSLTIALPNWSRARCVRELVCFYRKHKHWDFIAVPGPKAEQLGAVATKIRADMRAARLPPTLLRQLTVTEFPTDGYAYRWTAMYAQLSAAITAKRRLPHALMTWWRRQRILDTEGQLMSQRSKALRALPFPEPTLYHWVLALEEIELAVKDRTALPKEQSVWLKRQVKSMTEDDCVVHWNRRFHVDREFFARLAKVYSVAIAAGLIPKKRR